MCSLLSAAGRDGLFVHTMGEMAVAVGLAILVLALTGELFRREDH